VSSFLHEEMTDTAAIAAMKMLIVFLILFIINLCLAANKMRKDSVSLHFRQKENKFASST
jgi:hypothetical protein